MEAPTYIDSIESCAAAMAGAGRTNIGAEVPLCPGWNVADVITHMGGVHRWAAQAVRTARRGEFIGPPYGVAGDDLVSWTEEGTAELVDALRSTDPDADVWTFAPPHSVRFWLRRQAHETAVHAWDSTDAVGAPLTLDPEMSADGVDEYLTLLVPRFLGRQPGAWAGETIHVHRTDGEGEWLIKLGPDGAATVDRAHRKGDLAVRGHAADLLLWANNRRIEQSLEMVGDESIADRWAEEIRF